MTCQHACSGSGACKQGRDRRITHVIPGAPGVQCSRGSSTLPLLTSSLQVSGKARRGSRDQAHKVQQAHDAAGALPPLTKPSSFLMMPHSSCTAPISTAIASGATSCCWWRSTYSNGRSTAGRKRLRPAGEATWGWSNTALRKCSALTATWRLPVESMHLWPR